MGQEEEEVGIGIEVEEMRDKIYCGGGADREEETLEEQEGEEVGIGGEVEEEKKIRDLVVVVKKKKKSKTGSAVRPPRLRNDHP